jgi:hypothetical protein
MRGRGGEEKVPFFQSIKKAVAYIKRQSKDDKMKG